jgi:hypothetical protein
MSQPRVKILVKPAPNGRNEITVLDTSSGRESRTGLVVPRDQVDAEVRKLKATFERAGSVVEVGST